VNPPAPPRSSGWQDRRISPPDRASDLGLSGRYAGSGGSGDCISSHTQTVAGWSRTPYKLLSSVSLHRLTVDEPGLRNSFKVAKALPTVKT
jgi:hypothetical protein